MTARPQRSIPAASSAAPSLALAVTLAILFAIAVDALSLFPTAVAGQAASPVAQPDLSPGPSAQAETYVLDRKVHLTLWRAGLKDAAREIKAQTGVDVLFYLADFPDNANTDNLYLATGNVSLATVMETMAARYGFRFRVTEKGQIEISKSYDWVAPESSLRFTRLIPLVPGDASPEGTRRFLAELVKPLPLLSGDFSLTLEKYPLPNHPDAFRAAAMLPPPLADYFDRAVKCLMSGDGDPPAGSLRPDRRFSPRGRQFPVGWENLLGRQVTAPRGGDIKFILSDLADQAGVAIILNGPPAGPGKPLPADVERYSLARVTEALAEAWGLGRRVFLATGGVLFERGATGEYEIDGRSREFFWNDLAVAGFPARAHADRAGGGQALINNLRREIFPTIWRDPVCALLYSSVTGRLVVVAPENVAAAVGEWLSRSR